jgi:hypothetical protein
MSLIMSLKKYFLPFFFLLISFSAPAQSDIINQVKDAIKAGSAKELAKFLNSTVDVTLEGNVQSYSKAQGEFVLRDFFKQHPPSEVNVIHQGSSKGGQPFAILQYKSGADTFRLFMKIKSVGNTQYVDDIRFTRE